MKIALINVKYSPNLGDGLLSECLERELASALPGSEVFSIDLAGRRDYIPIGPSNRGKMLAVLEALPGRVRALVARVMLTALVRLRLRPGFRAQLAGCDAAVIGGGNLFADADLNFPMKIAGALAEVRARSLPVAVFGVGVTRNWSAIGSDLFGKGLARARLVEAAVRDERSQAAWNDMLAPYGVGAATIVRDPGLLAALHYPRSKPSDDGKLVGLCVTDPLALRYHAGRDRVSADLDQWFPELARALVLAGFRVALFTNGSPEDRDYLSRNASAWIRIAKGPVTNTSAFADPGELVQFISGCDLMIAHRMHACIAAHSFAIPTIGLTWDVKLDSFFAIAGRSEYMVDPAQVPPQATAALAEQALAQGVDAAAHRALIGRGQADVAQLAALLAQAIAERRA